MEVFLLALLSWCIAFGHYTIGNSMAELGGGQLHSLLKILGVNFVWWRFRLRSRVSASGGPVRAGFVLARRFHWDEGHRGFVRSKLNRLLSQVAASLRVH